MKTLFPMQQNFHIVRLTEHDAARATDSLRLFGEQLVLNEEMYPDIKGWFHNKVVPGLRNGSRVAYLGFEGEVPVLTAVLKRGEHAKFCHLRIASEFQDLHLGEIFFSIMALEVRNTAKEIHFTLPESLWEQRRGFFSSFGFRDVIRAHHQYRLFEQELRTSAPFWDVWRATRQKLPRLVNRFLINDYSLSPTLLLSIRPEFAKRVLDGQKTIEIRRRFHNRWRGARVALYASSPERALVGEATIDTIRAAPPLDIWSLYENHIGCSFEQFSQYTEGRDQVFAIELCDVVPYASRMPVCQFEYLLEGELNPPQSHCLIRGDDQWGKAVSIAALLHGCNRSVNRGFNAL